MSSPPASDAAVNGNQSPQNRQSPRRPQGNLDVVILTMEGYRAAHFGDLELAQSYFAAAEAACVMAAAPTPRDLVGEQLYRQREYGDPRPDVMGRAEPFATMQDNALRTDKQREAAASR